MRFKRQRRLPGRKLARPGRPEALSDDPAALDLPVEDSRSGESTEFAVPSVAAALPVGAELPTLEPYEDPDSEPAPPSRMPFVCPCGAKLIASSATYDKHSRCSMCQTVLLLNLVYDPEQRSHEIVPFRIDPNSPL
jgi:hypothetical protein